MRTPPVFKALLLASTIGPAFAASAEYRLFYRLPSGIHVSDETKPGGPTGPTTPTDPLQDDVYLQATASQDLGRMFLNKPNFKDVVFTAAGTRGTLQLDQPPGTTGAQLQLVPEDSDCTGAQLAPGQSCKVRIVVNPIDAGPLSGSVYLTPNGATQPSSVTLTGTAVNPVAWVPSTVSGNVYSQKQWDLKSMVVVEEPHWDPAKLKITATSIPSGLSVNSSGELVGWLSGVAKELPLSVRASYEGNSASTDLHFQLKFTPLTDVTSASHPADGSYGCAIANAKAYCWGVKTEVLGPAVKNPGRIYSAVPIEGLPAVKAITNGVRHACAVSTVGEVWCWGSNEVGELTTAAQLEQLTPMRIPGFDGPVKALATAAYTNCALLENGSVQCWGLQEWWNLGAPSMPVPKTVSNNVGALTTLSGNNSTFCGVTSDTRVACWGANHNWMLGQGNSTFKSDMVPVVAPNGTGSGYLTGMASVSVGHNHVCAAGGGKAYCWGVNDSGQLGLGEGAGSGGFSPNSVSVLGLNNVSSIVALKQRTCASTALGWVCWGSKGGGSLGVPDDGKNAYIPLPLTGASGGMVFGGFYATCHVDTVGAVKCLGQNASGSMGSGNENTSLTLMPVVH